MKNIKAIQAKQQSLEEQIEALSDSGARVAQRAGKSGDIEICTAGMAEEDIAELVRVIDHDVSKFIQSTRTEKCNELSFVNGVIDKVEKLLEQEL